MRRRHRVGAAAVAAALAAGLLAPVPGLGGGLLDAREAEAAVADGGSAGLGGTADASSSAANATGSGSASEGTSGAGASDGDAAASAAAAQQGGGAASTNAQPTFSPPTGKTAFSFTLTPGADGRLNPVSAGTATATDSDAGASLTFSLLPSDSASTVYMIGYPGASANATLYKVDAGSGRASRVGSASTGTGRSKLGGTAWHLGRLYAVATSADAQPGLHVIDIADGTATRIASATQMGLGSTASLLGLASHNSALYATTSDSGSGHVGLWEIDLSGTTPAATAVGASGMGASVTQPAALASHAGTLYLASVIASPANAQLATVNPATGAATVVNSATNSFGVSETAPGGMVSHNGSLYLAGSSNDALYTLNTSTGAATRVASSVTGFGTTPALTAAAGLAGGYDQPEGFAIAAATGAISYRGVPIEAAAYTLWARVSDGLSSTGTADTAIDDTVRVTVTVANTAPVFDEDAFGFSVLPATNASSTAVTVGAAEAADPDHGDELVYSLRPSDPANTLYMVGGQQYALFSMNKTTGAITRIGKAFSSGIINNVHGLTWHNGRLYLAASTVLDGALIFELDTASGVATRVAKLADLGVTLNGLTAIASHAGDLYVLGGFGVSKPLVKVDLATGTATALGSAGFGVGETSPSGLASHGATPKLYMVGLTKERLYTLNTTTGAATQVGTQDAGFGVSPTEGAPTGLASDGTSLYMVGYERDQLYTLNTTTGAATKVGSSFASTENFPQGLAPGYAKPSFVSIDAATGAISYSGTATNSTYENEWTVYARVSDGLDANNRPDAVIDDTAPVTVTVKNQSAAFGQRSYELYLPPGTNGSSNTYTVGRTAAADPDTADTLTYSLRASDPDARVYMIGTQADALFFVRSNAFSNQAVRINGTVSKFGVNEEASGLAWHNGKLYMLGQTADALYVLDTETGIAARVGNATAFGVGETVPTGLASHSSALYMVGAQTDALYRLDPRTGVATRVGNAVEFGPDSSNKRQAAPVGLASVGSTLYLLGSSPRRLSTLNVSTGVATHVGSEDFGLTTTTPNALGVHGGTLYAYSVSNGTGLLSLTTAGVGTLVTTFANFGVGETAVTGIATGYSKPASFAIQSDGDIEYSGSAATGGDEHTLYAKVQDGKQADNTAGTAIDDTVPVTVRVQNLPPSFAPDDYHMFLTVGATSQALGTLAATDPESDTLSYSLRASDGANTLYMVGQQHDALYSMNKTTGAVTRIGDAVNFGTDVTGVHAMAWHQGKLYMLASRPGSSSNILYALDTDTGVATFVMEPVLSGSVEGLASHDGYLYAAATLFKPLVRIDVEARTATELGSFGFGVSETQPRGLASHGATPKLYMVGTSTDKLWTLNPSTGAATQVGTQSAGFGVSPSEGDPAGLASDGTSLYMVGSGSDQLYTLNTTTGAATKVGSSFSGTENDPHGLSGRYVTPSGFAVGSSTGALSWSQSTGASAGDVFTLYAQVNDGKSSSGGSSTDVDATAPVTVRVMTSAAPAGPDRPSVAATAGAGGSLDVAWAAPFDNASAVAGYDVRYRGRSGGPAAPWSTWAHSGTDASVVVNRGLSGGAAYEVQVRARNSVGAGVWSNSGYANTAAATKPPAPPAPSVRAGNDKIYVTLPALGDGGSPLTGVSMKAQKADGTGTVWSSTFPNIGQRSAIVPSAFVSNGTAYKVWLSVTNALGTTAGVKSASVTPTLSVPEAPPGLEADVASTHGAVDLTWAQPSDNGGSAITSYTVQYRGRAAGSNAAWPSQWQTFTGTTFSQAAAVTGLLGANEYQFRVVATNAQGDSLPGYEIDSSGPTQPTSAVPNAPTVAVTAVSGTGSQLTVTLSGAKANGTAGITDYDVAYQACTANCSTSTPTWPQTWTDRPGETAADTTLSVTLSGLAGGTKYRVRARAANSLGEGAWSAGTVQSTNAAVAPERPTDFRVNSANESAVVGWAPPADDGGAAITKYVVTVSPVGGDAYTVDVTAPSQGTTVGSLTNGTTYRIKAAAVNSVGTGPTAPESPAAGIPVIPASTRPSAPTGATATAGNAKLTLGWTAPADNGGLAISGYKVRYRAASSSTWLTPANEDTTCDSTTGASRQCELSSLTNGTAYQVAVRATNSIGDSEWSWSATGTPGKPDTPTDLTVAFGTTSVTQGTATLSASIAANGGSSITAWQYQRVTGTDTAFGTTWSDISSSASRTLSATVTGNTAGSVYKFRVRAKSAIGTSDPSNAVTVTVPTNLPPVFGTTASPVSSFSFDLAAGTTGAVGAPAAIGTAAAADPDSGDTLTWGLQHSPNGAMYFLHDPTGTANDALYRVDLATGAATQVGSATNFGQGTTALGAVDMTWHHGRLFMVGSSSAVLYELDPDTGTAAQAGSTASGFGVSETSPVGIASHSGVLYMIGTATDALYSLDPISGAATKVGTATNFGDTGSVDLRTGLASHGGTLYTLNRTSLWLESLSTTAGDATRVGTQTNFGTGGVGPPNYAGEDLPAGLVSFGTTAKLYMVGSRHNRLYTLATSGANAGKATVAASLSSGITDPAGLAGGYAKPAGYAVASGTGAVGWTSSTGVAYGRYRLRAQVRDSKSPAGVADTAWDATVPVTVDVVNTPPAFGAAQYSARLRSGQDGSGTAIDVVTVSAADAQSGDSVTYGLRPSDAAATMYALNYTSSNDEALYTVSSSTGAATRVGNVQRFGQTARVDPTSLAWHRGRLYMVGQGTQSNGVAALWTLDTASGAATRAGTLDGFGVSESRPTGLASHSGTLYMIGSTNDTLYTLDPATGQATAVGSGLGGTSDRTGLASHSGALYTANSTGTYLETISTSTGTATRAGSTTDWGGTETSMSGFASHGATPTLYAVGEDNDKLYTINTTTGAATEAGSLGINSVSGLADGYRAPAGYAIAKITTGADSGKAKITYTGSSTPLGVWSMWARASDGKDRWGGAESTATWDAAALVTVTVTDAPAAPSGLVAVAGNGSVTLSSAAVPSGTTVTKWQYAYKTGEGAYGSWNDVTGTAITLPSTSVTVANGSAYTFKVRAVNGSTPGEDSSEATVTLASAVPTAPTGFTVSVAGTGATLSAEIALGSNSSTLMRDSVLRWQYAYKSKPVGGSYGSYGSWQDVAGNLLASAAVTGLTATSIYTFKVRAVNNIGNGTASSEVEANVAPEFEFAAGKSAYDAFVTPGADGSRNAVAVATVSATDANTADTVTYRLRPTDSSYTRPAGYAITKVASGADAGKALITYTGASAPAGTVTLHAQARDSKSSTGTADEVWDVSAPVTVKVENRPPAFGTASYVWTIPAGSDGSATAVALRNDDATAATVTAADPDGDTVSYFLQNSDAANVMYMTGGTADALYRLNATTGEATRVDAGVAAFGAGETCPQRLAWHHGVLYMIGCHKDGVWRSQLYTVNPFSGEAAVFATATELGVSSNHSLSAIESHNGVLYLATGGVDAKLRVVDLAARTSTDVGTTSNFGVHELAPTGLASLGGKLYMVGQAQAVLYTLSTADGTATRVGAATQFGISENMPVDLASLGGKLYLVGDDTDYLSELSHTTGVATRVGTATAYGVSEVAGGLTAGYAAPAGYSIGMSTGAVTWTGPARRSVAGTYGLWVGISDQKSSSGGRLRAPDAYLPAKVTVTNQPPSFSATAPSLWVPSGADGSGTAVTAGTVAATDPNGDALTYRLTPADAATKLYSLADNSGTANDGLWTFTTGGQSPAAVASAAVNFGQGSTELGARDLAWHNGRLYMIGATTAALYEVDPASGAAARVGAATAFGVSETAPSGIASLGGTLYLIGTATDKLYTLNAATGAATAVMSSTSNFGGSTDQARQSLAAVGTKLYTVNCGGGYLEELSTATGVATQVGSSSQFGVSETCARGLAAAGATPTLYMVGQSGATSKKLYTLDTATGAATLVSSVTGADNLSAPWGLAGGWTYTTGFAVGAADGAVTWTGSSAPAGTHWLRVQAHDGLDAVGKASAAWDALTVVSVRVTPANAAPAFGAASYAFGLASGTDGSAGTGVAVGAVSASDADASDTVAYGLAGSDPSTVLYMAGRTNGALYRVTPATGVAAKVGSLAANPWGMAWHGGALYAVAGDTGGALYRVNPFTGAAVSLASASVLTGSSGAKLRGLASHGGSLYMTTAAAGVNGKGQLWRVTVSTDGATAAATLMGDTDATVGNETSNIAEPIALASHGSPAVLYVLSRQQLYTANAATGALMSATDQGFRRTERKMAGMTSHGSPAVLYLTGEDGNTLYTVNISSGALTALATPTGGGFGASELLASGLAGGYAVPAGFAVTSSGASAGTVRWTGSSASATAGNRWLYLHARDGRDRVGDADTAWDATAQVQVSVATAPGSVSGLSATAGNGTVALAASVASGTSVTGWEYRYKTRPSGGSYGAYGSWTAVPSSAGVSLSASVSVDNGASYTFQARAVNLLVAGASSAEAEATLAAAVPPAATDAAASASGTTVTLSASVPASAEPVKQWEYLQDSGSGYGSWTAVASSASRTLSHELSGLTPSTTYKFKVRAVNNVGDGAQSTELSVTTGQPTPPAPSGFTATGGDGSVSLAASVPSGTTVTAWEYRYKTGQGSYGSWTAVPSSASVTLSASVTVSNGATHTFQVRAVNGSHLGTASGEATVVLGSAAPGAPSSLTATAGDGSVAVAASVTSGTVVYGWQYQLKTNNGAYGSWQTISGQTGLSVSFTLDSGDGIANGNTYRVKVRASNNHGEGAAGESATVQMRPAAATNLTASATGNGTVTLTASITGTGGSAVTRWEYRYKETSGGSYPDQWTQVPSSASTSLSVAVGSLTNGTSYTFVARAVNAVGASGASNEVSASPTATAPPAATDLAAAAASGQVTLTASISDNGGSAVTRWEYRYKETSGGTYPNQWTQVPSSASTSLSVVVGSLTNGTSYTFVVRARNSVGAGGASNEAAATPSATVPAAATNLAAAAGAGQVTLTASISDNGGSAVTRWEYRYKATSGGTYPNQWTQVPSSASNSLSVTVSNLSKGTSYTFVVRARNSVGAGGASNEAVATPPATAPAAATNLSASAGSQQVTLRASISDNGGSAVTRWEYRYKETSGGTYPNQWTQVPSSASNSLSVVVSSLTNGTSYTFVARAVNAVGAAGASNEASAAPAASTSPPPNNNTPGGNTGGGGGGGASAARPERLSGTDRWATAAAVSNKLVELLEAVDPATGVRRQVDTVIVASGQAFPDALTAAALSRVLRAPVLLTSKNRLEGPVRAFVARHRPTTAVIVGGPAAVSAEVEAALLAMNEITTVVRHAGADRYATAVKVAEAVGDPQRLCGTTKPTVIVTTGRNYPDALVAGPLAYRGQLPILLTDPDRLPDPVRDWLDGSPAKHAIVIGGQKAVSDSVVESIEGLGLSVERLSGSDRADTSVKVARRLIALVGTSGCFRKDAVGLATGWAFPDALAAAPLLGYYGAPLLLTSPDGVPQALIDYFAEGLLQPDFDLPPVTTIGGRAAVPTAHYNKLLANLPR